MGVSLAIRKLDKAIEDIKKLPGAKLYTLGPIIHNPQLVSEYEAKGAVCLEDADKAEPGSTVIIRAHGLPKEIEQSLHERGLNVIDATCPKVKSAQIAIQKAKKAGNGTMILYGEADHPEVKGLLSYADYDAVLFNSLDELANLPLDKNSKYFVAAQTTQDKNIFEDALHWLAEFYGHDLPVLRTICDATKNRQHDVIALADQVKSMVIVGGMNSGNTRRLADISKNLGIFTVHCEHAGELPLEELKTLEPVGLSAGASTPDAHINEVEQALLKI